MKYIFFTLNIVFVLLAHFVVFIIWRRLLSIDDIYLQIAVAALLLLSIALTAIAPLLIHWRDSIFSRALYLVVALWGGVMVNIALTAFAMLLFGWIGISFTSLTEKYLIIIVPLLLLLPEAWQAQVHRVKRVTVPITDLPESWSGKEIVHLSDVHLGPIWRQRFFDRLVRRVNRLGAAAIFISGDLFDGMDTDFDWFHERRFDAPFGVYYAFGNHDLNLGIERVTSLLKNSNISILNNEMMVVSGLQIIGINCYYEGRLDLSRQIAALPGYQASKPSILMYHEPKDVEAAKRAGIDLQLSGHTHGGQMFPANLVAQLLYRGFGKGIHRRGNYTISVTVGAGTWGPPLRLGTRSEIVVLKLIKG